MSDAEKIARSAVETCNEWETLCAEKDAEIQRLREALETLAAPLDDKKRPYEGWWPVRVLARKWGIYEEDVQDAMDLIPLVARAALNPREQVSSACAHQRHDECRFAACVCECHNPPQQKDGE